MQEPILGRHHHHVVSLTIIIIVGVIFVVIVISNILGVRDAQLYREILTIELAEAVRYRNIFPTSFYVVHNNPRRVSNVRSMLLS